eukprot:5342774-Alexandrium_andersonii.AAC.1
MQDTRQLREEVAEIRGHAGGPTQRPSLARAPAAAAPSAPASSSAAQGSDASAPRDAQPAAPSGTGKK